MRGAPSRALRLNWTPTFRLNDCVSGALYFAHAPELGRLKSVAPRPSWSPNPAHLKHRPGSPKLKTLRVSFGPAGLVRHSSELLLKIRRA